MVRKSKAEREKDKLIRMQKQAQKLQEKMQNQTQMIQKAENDPSTDEDVVIPLQQQPHPQPLQQQPQPLMQQQAAPMNFAQEEEKEPVPMDGVQFTPTVAEPEMITKGQESDGEMYYVPSSTQSTPNIIGNASEIHEEQDQQEESVGQQTTIISTRRQKREKARAAKVAESQNFA